MKSKFIKLLTLILVLSCVCFSFSACDMYDDPVEVVFIDETGAEVCSENVSILSKGIVPELNRIFKYDEIELPQGTAKCRSFRGWSYNPDAINPEVGHTIKSDVQANNTLSYKQIKDHIVDGKVTMYAVWAPYADLVVGWDARSLSGLTDTIIAKFQTSLTAYLETQGLSGLTVKFYKFDQEETADLGAAVKKNGSINVLIGVGSNINQNPGGNLSVMALTGNIPMGGKSRYIVRMDNKDLSKLVYDWLQTAEGQLGLKK